MLIFQYLNHYLTCILFLHFRVLHICLCASWWTGVVGWVLMTNQIYSQRSIPDRPSLSVCSPSSISIITSVLYCFCISKCYICLCASWWMGVVGWVLMTNQIYSQRYIPDSPSLSVCSPSSISIITSVLYCFCISKCYI